VITLRVRFNHHGNFKNIDRFLKNNSSIRTKYYNLLRKYGERGVKALVEHTPKDTGKTADSWSYEIRRTNKGFSIEWHNDNTDGGVPIIVLLQYGHATGNGGWVQGVDIINPALKPIFDELSNDLWEEVKRA
jgi:hypothetical protein